MTNDSAPSTLPPELEREIFETTAVLREKMIPTLLLVARRVHECYLEALFRMLDYRPSHVFPQACRHLFLVTMALGTGWNADSADRILRACTGVTEIFIFSDPVDFDPLLPFLSTVSQMRPTHLTLFGNILPLRYVPNAGNYNYTLSRTWAHWPALAGLATLTHLAVFPDQDLATHILSILPDLHALVFYTHMGYPDMPRDPRIFVESMSRFKTLWRSGAQGGDDIWVRADEFIARKRRGEIPKSVYHLPEEVSYSMFAPI
ncbi:hypothetical protein FB45DRAFT_1108397 [Roridomyces roridus]|uniref:Uncharacterized protein n=1 Tax=Roridomyces roridus TaxID=1738132 RepID=A0AAD7BAM6_9AGAR|nr:hypothetical protein FB45DRAFT_1108397 [Roridomyces roridus]